MGIKDEDFKKAGVEIKNSSKEVLESCNLLIKVNSPQDDEIKNSVKSNCPKVQIQNRPLDIAQDETSTEEVINFFLDEFLL